jgi:hypothetical protein
LSKEIESTILVRFYGLVRCDEKCYNG